MSKKIDFTFNDKKNNVDLTFEGYHDGFVLYGNKRAILKIKNDGTLYLYKLYIVDQEMGLVKDENTGCISISQTHHTGE